MATKKASATTEGDAIALLTSDHEKVHELFSEFAALKEEGSDEEKTDIVAQICKELTVHTQIEEEIFYPAVRKAIKDSDMMDEALVEHAGAKALIAQLEAMDPGDDLYDAKVTVLGEQIDHHVEEEESEMFPQAQKAKVDTKALGGKMLDRKIELMEDMEVDSAEDAEDAEPVAKPKKKRAKAN